MINFLYLIFVAAIFGVISSAVIGTAFMYLENKKPIFKVQDEQFKKLFQRFVMLVWAVNSLLFVVIECLRKSN